MLSISMLGHFLDKVSWILGWMEDLDSFMPGFREVGYLNTSESELLAWPKTEDPAAGKVTSLSSHPSKPIAVSRVKPWPNPL